MATAQKTTPAAIASERAAAEPFAQQLLALAREADPEATYALAPPIDPGIWIMHLYVRRDLVDDLDFTTALAERTTDILIQHDLGIATLLHTRGGAPQTPARSGTATA